VGANLRLASESRYSTRASKAHRFGRSYAVVLQTWAVIAFFYVEVMDDAAEAQGCCSAGRATTLLTVATITAALWVSRRRVHGIADYLFTTSGSMSSWNSPNATSWSAASPSPSAKSVLFPPVSLAPRSVYESPPYAPVTSCPVVYMYKTLNEGVGHRMTGFAIALWFASRANASMVIDRKTMYDLHRITDTREANYHFLERVFNLGRFVSLPDVGMWNDPVTELPWGTFRPGNTQIRDPTVFTKDVEKGGACGTVWMVATGEGVCGPGGWCMALRGLGGSFMYAQSILAPLYAEGEYARRPLRGFQDAYARTPRPLTVAWHVRNGDLRRNGDVNFFLNLLGSVKKGLGDLPAQHYIFAQYAVDGSEFGFFKSQPDTPFVDLTTLSIDESLHHLIGADVLVHFGGSSFSNAATLASPASQVKLYVDPKDVHLNPEVRKTYFVKGSIVVDTTGTVPASLEANLAALLQTRFDIISGCPFNITPPAC
jgi:hypothetical protein